MTSPLMSSRRLFVAMLLLCLAPVSARAQQFDYGSVRLLQTGERSGALFFSLNPSWKISWRKNTVNVFPTELSWRSNASSFLWPFPQTFSAAFRQYQHESQQQESEHHAERVCQQGSLQLAACLVCCLSFFAVCVVGARERGDLDGEDGKDARHGVQHQAAEEGKHHQSQHRGGAG